MTDLGTIGLTGDGFELAHTDVVDLSGTIGDTTAEDAVSIGKPVEPVRSEISNSFDLGFRYGTPRLRIETTGFLLDLEDTIVKQALILPPGATGRVSFAGQPVVRQTPGGAVFVPISSDPVLVRTNLDATRHYGMESQTEIRATAAWILRGNFTWFRALNRANGAAPNVEGGTPTPRGTWTLGISSGTPTLFAGTVGRRRCPPGTFLEPGPEGPPDGGDSLAPNDREFLQWRCNGPWSGEQRHTAPNGRDTPTRAGSRPGCGH